MFPCDFDGVQTNLPVLESIVAPVGSPSKLKTASVIEVSISPTVNESVFSTSIDLSAIDFSSNTKSGTSNNFFPSNSSFIVNPSSSF